MKLNLPVDAITKSYCSGISPQKLSVEYGCDIGTIVKRLKDADVDMRSASESQVNRFKDQNERDIARTSNLKRFCDMSERNRISESLKNYYESPEARKRASVAAKKRYDEDPSAIDKISGENHHHWMGGHDKTQPHLKPVGQCIKINDWFAGANAHHVTRSIVCYIPTELHQHIGHNLITGKNMGEMNMLALQFINGGYDG